VPFNSQLKGTAYVFVRAAGTWSQQAKLTASDSSPADEMATSIAVSADTLVAGAPNKAAAQGGTYVFVRSGVNWTQQARPAASDGSNGDEFGISTSVSGDTVLVGAVNKAQLAGAAYVFVRSGASWVQQAKLTASDAAAGDTFGVSVSIDGDTAIIGANGKSGKGAAYVFVRSAGAWSQQAKLNAADGAAGDNFGISVAANGDTAVVTANGKNSGQGAAYVFIRSGATWTQQAKLTASDPANNDFWPLRLAQGRHGGGLG
jgi:hypothetical protein